MHWKHAAAPSVESDHLVVVVRRWDVLLLERRWRLDEPSGWTMTCDQLIDQLRHGGLALTNDTEVGLDLVQHLVGHDGEARSPSHNGRIGALANSLHDGLGSANVGLLAEEVHVVDVAYRHANHFRAGGDDRLLERFKGEASGEEVELTDFVAGGSQCRGYHANAYRINRIWRGRYVRGD